MIHYHVSIRIARYSDPRALSLLDEVFDITIDSTTPFRNWYKIFKSESFDKKEFKKTVFVLAAASNTILNSLSPNEVDRYAS